MGHEATIDPQRLHALVTSVVAARQRVARAQADESRLLADAVEMVVSAMEAERAHGSHHRSRADLPMREVAAELATAMRVTDRTVQRRMGDASQLASRFPATLAAWEEGSIDSAHLNALLDAGGQIDDDDARGRFEARALEVARMETAARCERSQRRSLRRSTRSDRRSGCGGARPTDRCGFSTSTAGRLGCWPISPPPSLTRCTTG